MTTKTMQTEKYSPMERRLLLVMAAAFVLLGLTALLRDGQITGAFWTLAAAANLAGFLSVFGRKWTQNSPCRLDLNPAKILFIVMVFALLNRTGTFERMAAADVEKGGLLGLRIELLFGADRNAATGPMQRTLIATAVDRKRQATARFLLEAGADPNRADRYGWTPLMIARYQGDEKMAALLIRYGAVERPLPVLLKRISP